MYDEIEDYGSESPYSKCFDEFQMNEIKNKLYIRPIPLSYSKEYITEMFSTYGKIVETYISDSKNDFRWGFISFENNEDARRAYELKENLPFKIDFAMKKVKSGKYANNLKNGNSEDYMSPPNCAFCKKITFLYCVTCKNYFCNHNCALDGWRFHHPKCIYVPKLYHVHKNTAVSHQKELTETVVGFMRKIMSTKQKFSPDEFASVCSGSDPNYLEEFSDKYRKHDLTSFNNNGTDELLEKWDSEDEDDCSTDSEKQKPESSLSKESDILSRKRDLKDDENQVQEKCDLEESRFDRSCEGIDTFLKSGVSNEVVVTCIVSNRVFFVADFENLTQLTNQIEIESKKFVKYNEIEKHSLCMAFLEGSWYRSKIVNENPLIIDLIDFGSQEECELSSLRTYPDKFRAIRPLAVRANLHNGDINFEEGMEIVITPLKYDLEKLSWVVKLDDVKYDYE